jgi:hypothetical protein
VIPKRLGERIAGHKYLRKIEAEMRLSLISSLPACSSLSLNVWKTSLSSLKIRRFFSCLVKIKLPIQYLPGEILMRG